MDPSLASSQNLTSDSVVDLNVIIDPKSISKLEVEPDTADDWENIQLHAGMLESQIISQTRAIALDQRLILYISGSIKANLKVLKVEPEVRYGLLSPFAEIAIASKTRRQQTKKSTSARSASRARSSLDDSPTILLRGIPLPHPIFEETHNECLFEAHVNFHDISSSLPNTEYVEVSIVPGPKAKDTQGQSQLPPQGRSQYTSKIIAKLINNPKANGSVGLSRILSIALSLDRSVGQVVQLKKVNKPSDVKPIIAIQPIITESLPEVSKVSLSEDILIKKKEKLTQQKADILNSFLSLQLNNTVLTNSSKIPIMQGLTKGGILKFKDESLKFVHLSGKNDFKIEIEEEVLIPKSESPQSIHTEVNRTDYPIGQEEILKKIEKAVRRGNIGALVYGNSGSGKTLIVNEISQKLHDKGYFRINVDCYELSKIPVQNLKEKFELLFNRCSWHSPSLLLLEGIESIFPVESEQGDVSQTRQLTEFFIQSANSLNKNKTLTILATARSKESINSLLLSSHCIEETFSLQPPSKQIREKIITEYLKIHKLSFDKTYDSTQLSVDTEGFLPKDLKILADRIHHECIYDSIKTGKVPNLITNANFTKAIKDYTPSGLRGVKLQKSTTSWNDIGGLRDAKAILLETLEWPTKYAPIFKSATLRLRSGILLYGYPGCGKTLLASVISSQCGLNFISVKGPEILNKYIGASEQSIRELFERAQAAKPCILFFDEFDSIAPKRGHDSTGVTDRVVNQMLTQMDGAEGLDGVYVLAATSRPDLIDSALLRPGRLDKSVICDLPDFEDRLDIIRSITRKMNLSDDVRLDEISGKADGFSGADLQGVCYNAYLKAVHRKLDLEKLEMEGKAEKGTEAEVHEFFQLCFNEKTPDVIKTTEKNKLSKQVELLLQSSKVIGENKETITKIHKKEPNVHITHLDFITALDDTKPSISQSEKAKLGGIYHKFIAERDGNMQDGSSGTEVGARTTLA
ncbi:hypothetical protein WICMUC_001537 [Wickerhamomyces mucosus]|uniref:Peroxisomal ATPase PEX1 n=1 Tax=Wickerhamomyces mucosus TaxID=1378264 RepID=A0A9P8PVS0_9ASCO|nr:hypothetical protein WICMUC_001537 [Wickerhamomyces mucosus]